MAADVQGQKKCEAFNGKSFTFGLLLDEVAGKLFFPIVPGSFKYFINGLTFIEGRRKGISESFF
jgi:hypothetical protein